MKLMVLMSLRLRLLVLTFQIRKQLEGSFLHSATVSACIHQLLLFASPAKELGQLDRTYFFFSSDHGFQLGQFNIPMDKRHVYEWDTKNLGRSRSELAS